MILLKSCSPTATVLGILISSGFLFDGGVCFEGRGTLEEGRRDWLPPAVFPGFQVKYVFPATLAKASQERGLARPGGGFSCQRPAGNELVQQTILSLFSNTYEEQPGERMCLPWLRLWKNG